MTESYQYLFHFFTDFSFLTVYGLFCLNPSVNVSLFSEFSSVISLNMQTSLVNNVFFLMNECTVCMYVCMYAVTWPLYSHEEQLADELWNLKTVTRWLPVSLCFLYCAQYVSSDIVGLRNLGFRNWVKDSLNHIHFRIAQGSRFTVLHICVYQPQI